MNLLAPLFLLGALAVVAPIVAHLVRRATRDRVQFSATEFLDPSLPHFSRRNRIEHPWLLFLRCLVVAALALGFSRPLWRSESPILPGAHPPRHVVVVLDQSASMRRSDLSEAARDRIRALAAGLRETDAFALVGTRGSGATLLAAEAWNAAPPDQRAALLEGVLDASEAGWGPSHLDAAIDVALEEIESMAELNAADAPGEIVIVSDFAASVRVSGLAGRDWPSACTVKLEEIQPAVGINASVHFLGWTEPAQGGSPVVRLRVAHDSAQVLPVRLRIRGAADSSEASEPVEMTLAPQESRVVPVELPVGVTGPLRIDLEGDSEPFDNTAWLVPPQLRRISIVSLAHADAGERDDPRQSAYYVTRALRELKGAEVTLTMHDPRSRTALPDGALVLVTDALDGDVLRGLREKLDAGASVLVLARDASVVAVAGALAGERGWNSSAYPRADALLGEIDFRHPLFSLFADPRYSDFTRVRFWKPVPLALPPDSHASVLARFEDRSPAFVEVPVGRGMLMAWGGDWVPESSQWVLSSKFVPWLQTLLIRAAGGPAGADSAEVGDTRRVLAGPDAQWRSIATIGSESAASTGEVPGIYQLVEGERTRFVALQVPAAESRTDKHSLDTWEQLGVPIGDAPAAQAALAANRSARSRNDTALEREQKLWRWLLSSAALLLVVESLAAIRIASTKSTTVPQT